MEAIARSDDRSHPKPGWAQRFAITVPDFDPSLLPKFAALIYEDPLIERFERTRDGRQYRISDMIDQPTFHGLALYQEFYRHIGLEWQVAFTLPVRLPLIVGIALAGERHDFTDREVQLLGVARPHLIQAYGNAELWSARKATHAALEHGLDTLGQQIVVLDHHGRVEFATDGARRLLGDTLANRRGLADVVRALIDQSCVDVCRPCSGQLGDGASGSWRARSRRRDTLQAGLQPCSFLGLRAVWRRVSR